MEAGILVYKNFPQSHWRRIYSTNPLERLNKAVKRQTNVVGVFPDRDSVIRLVGLPLMEAEIESLADATVIGNLDGSELPLVNHDMLRVRIRRHELISRFRLDNVFSWWELDAERAIGSRFHGGYRVFAVSFSNDNCCFERRALAGLAVLNLGGAARSNCHGTLNAGCHHITSRTGDSKR